MERVKYYFRDLIEGFLLTKFHWGDFFLHAHCAWFGDAFDSFGEDQHHHIHHVGCMQCSHSLKNACYFLCFFKLCMQPRATIVCTKYKSSPAYENGYHPHYRLCTILMEGRITIIIATIIAIIITIIISSNVFDKQWNLCFFCVQLLKTYKSPSSLLMSNEDGYHPHFRFNMHPGRIIIISCLI